MSELFQQLDKNHEPELKYTLTCHGYTKAKHITHTPSHEDNSNFPPSLTVITHRPVVPSRNLSGQQLRVPFDPQLLRVLNNNLCQSEDVQKKFFYLSAELVTSLDNRTANSECPECESFCSKMVDEERTQTKIRTF